VLVYSLVVSFLQYIIRYEAGLHNYHHMNMFKSSAKSWKKSYKASHKVLKPLYKQFLDGLYKSELFQNVSVKWRLSYCVFILIRDPLKLLRTTVAEDAATQGIVSKIDFVELFCFQFCPPPIASGSTQVNGNKHLRNSKLYDEIHFDLF
jgi:hypothetical protein